MLPHRTLYKSQSQLDREARRLAEYRSNPGRAETPYELLTRPEQQKHCRLTLGSWKSTQDDIAYYESQPIRDVKHIYRLRQREIECKDRYEKCHRALHTTRAQNHVFRKVPIRRPARPQIPAAPQAQPAPRNQPPPTIPPPEAQDVKKDKKEEKADIKFTTITATTRSTLSKPDKKSESSDKKDNKLLITNTETAPGTSTSCRRSKTPSMPPSSSQSKSNSKSKSPVLAPAQYPLAFTGVNAHQAPQAPSSPPQHDPAAATITKQSRKRPSKKAPLSQKYVVESEDESNAAEQSQESSSARSAPVQATHDKGKGKEIDRVSTSGAVADESEEEDDEDEDNDEKKGVEEDESEEEESEEDESEEDESEDEDDDEDGKHVREGEVDKDVAEASDSSVQVSVEVVEANVTQAKGDEGKWVPPHYTDRSLAELLDAVEDVVFEWVEGPGQKRNWNRQSPACQAAFVRNMAKFTEEEVVFFMAQTGICFLPEVTRVLWPEEHRHIKAAWMDYKNKNIPIGCRHVLHPWAFDKTGKPHSAYKQTFRMEKDDAIMRIQKTYRGSSRTSSTAIRLREERYGGQAVVSTAENPPSRPADTHVQVSRAPKVNSRTGIARTIEQGSTEPEPYPDQVLLGSSIDSDDEPHVNRGRQATGTPSVGRSSSPAIMPADDEASLPRQRAPRSSSHVNSSTPSRRTASSASLTSAQALPSSQTSRNMSSPGVEHRQKKWSSSKAESASSSPNVSQMDDQYMDFTVSIAGPTRQPSHGSSASHLSEQATDVAGVREDGELPLPPVVDPREALSAAAKKERKEQRKAAKNKRKMEERARLAQQEDTASSSSPPPSSAQSSPLSTNKEVCEEPFSAHIPAPVQNEDDATGHSSSSRPSSSKKDKANAVAPLPPVALDSFDNIASPVKRMRSSDLADAKRMKRAATQPLQSSIVHEEWDANASPVKAKARAGLEVARKTPLGLPPNVAAAAEKRRQKVAEANAAEAARQSSTVGIANETAASVAARKVDRRSKQDHVDESQVREADGEASHGTKPKKSKRSKDKDQPKQGTKRSFDTADVREGDAGEGSSIANTLNGSDDGSHKEHRSDKKRADAHSAAAFDGGAAAHDAESSHRKDIAAATTRKADKAPAAAGTKAPKSSRCAAGTMPLLNFAEIDAIVKRGVITQQATDAVLKKYEAEIEELERSLRQGVPLHVGEPAAKQLAESATPALVINEATVTQAVDPNTPALAAEETTSEPVVEPIIPLQKVNMSIKQRLDRGLEHGWDDALWVRRRIIQQRQPHWALSNDLRSPTLSKSVAARDANGTTIDPQSAEHLNSAESAITTVSSVDANASDDTKVPSSKKGKDGSKVKESKRGKDKIIDDTVAENPAQDEQDVPTKPDKGVKEDKKEKKAKKQFAADAAKELEDGVSATPTKKKKTDKKKEKRAHADNEEDDAQDEAEKPKKRLKPAPAASPDVDPANIASTSPPTATSEHPAPAISPADAELFRSFQALTAGPFSFNSWNKFKRMCKQRASSGINVVAEAPTTASAPGSDFSTSRSSTATQSRCNTGRQSKAAPTNVRHTARRDDHYRPALHENSNNGRRHGRRGPRFDDRRNKRRDLSLESDVEELDKITRAVYRVYKEEKKAKLERRRN